MEATFILQEIEQGLIHLLTIKRTERHSSKASDIVIYDL
jgi:hypothetical protein